MKKELFIVTSYHHILTAIAKKYANHSDMDIFISNRSTGDEYWNIYLEEMRGSGWFNNIFYFDESSMRPPSPSHILETYKYELGGEKKIIESIEGFDIFSYDLIYVIDDKMFLGSTIVREKIPFHLCEDTVLTYQMMNKAKSSRVLAAPYDIICPILKALNYWHPVFGYGKSCLAIESSTSENLPKRLPHNKIKVVDRMLLINSIPDVEKKRICNMFLDAESVDYMRKNRNSVMIMTCPLIRDRMDYHLQISVVERLMSMYKGKHFIIKPHPRDDTDYQQVFPEAIVLKRTFPSEVFGFLEGIEIEEVVSVGSTSVNSCNFARNKRLLMPKELGVID